MPLSSHWRSAFSAYSFTRRLVSVMVWERALHEESGRGDVLRYPRSQVEGLSGQLRRFQIVAPIFLLPLLGEIGLGRQRRRRPKRDGATDGPGSGLPRREGREGLLVPPLVEHDGEVGGEEDHTGCDDGRPTTWTCFASGPCRARDGAGIGFWTLRLPLRFVLYSENRCDATVAATVAATLTAAALAALASTAPEASSQFLLPGDSLDYLPLLRPPGREGRY